MEPLKHECGVAMIRLRKPLHYYQEKYGTWQYGLNKLYLLMEKQHNRGQEGAGMACVKMHATAGEEYMFRERALGSGAITEIFDKVHKEVDSSQNSQAGLVQDLRVGLVQKPQAGLVQDLRVGLVQKPQAGSGQNSQAGSVQDLRVGLGQEPQLDSVQDSYAGSGQDLLAGSGQDSGQVPLRGEPKNQGFFGESAMGRAEKPLSAIQGDENLSDDLEFTEGGLQLAKDDSFERLPWAGELYMGHLRYSTTGKSGLQYVHPFLRRNNWRARNLCLCGNFNMTNVDDIFRELTSVGQHPRVPADTYILLEQMGHRLDRESERCYTEAVAQGLRGPAITEYIEKHINLANVLRESSRLWDGGYVICGTTGSGEMFSMRDPWGIRPAFYYADEEVVVVASERPVIQTAFDLPIEAVRELKPGEALLINQAGEMHTEQIIATKDNQACAFERIYFSRGSDAAIYKERKMLGAQLMPNILKAIDGDVQHTVFSFIPNTAEVAFYGMTEAFDYYMREHNIPGIVRREKVAWKDIKLRTFIAESNSRNDLAAHVYDITYGSLVPKEDYLVVIDDSIVRGTTLRESIIRILDRLQPKKMVLVSSAPQIRYPDYYGIDMAHMSEFIAFKAAIALLRERGMEQRIEEVYRQCAAQRGLPASQMKNYVKEIYAPFTDEDISRKMVELLKAPERPSKSPLKAPQTSRIFGDSAKGDFAATENANAPKTDIEIVFQTVEGLHAACPNHPGDWYFSGNYPTPGGVKRLNTAYMEWYETK